MELVADETCDFTIATIGTACWMTMKMMIAPNIPTSIYVEIFAPNTTQSFIIGKPEFKYGSNYNPGKTWVQMSSAYDDSRVILEINLTL